jgi:DNA-directed RNA polymerase subunit RPC12/RpoP
MLMTPPAVTLRMRLSQIESVMSSVKQESLTTLSCSTCHQELPERTTKKQKPYFHCDYCGVQIFFRLPEGIARLHDSLARAIVEDDFVLCRECQVAVRRSRDQISGTLFGTSGIRCPKCGDLLLRADEVGSRSALNKLSNGKHVD